MSTRDQLAVPVHPANHLRRTARASMWRWYHGMAFYIVMQLLAAGLSALATSARSKGRGRGRRPMRGDTRWSDTLKRPVFQPPNWVFPIAWPINNVCQIWGELRVLNKPRGTRGRAAYLGLQAATWANYTLFSAGYFGLRSTLNSLTITSAYLVLTVASGWVALFRLRDWKVALSLLTTFLWLCVALPSAIAQALWNRDAFYGVGPFVKPNRALLKRGG